jgi:hypothetical protein
MKLTKTFTAFCSFWWKFYKKRGENMKLTKEQISQSSKSHVKEAETRILPEADNYSQLKAWVQSVIKKAEKNRNQDKVKRFQILLADLVHIN